MATKAPNESVEERITNDGLQLIKDLLTGATLRHFQEEFERIDACREKASAHLEKLSCQDREIIRETLREILNQGEQRNLPLLEQLVNEETPCHKQMPLVLAALRAGVPVWLFGDAGSGKTTTAARAAKMLDLPFRCISVCPTTTKSEFFGYRDGNGMYHPTAFREVYETGGVFLIDEIDNGNPSTLAILNTAFANECCAFPDANVPRHERALFVAAANTIGRGADIRYIGRNALDATTLDRFVFIRMDIDENLENAISGGPYKQDEKVDLAEGGPMTSETWVELVRAVREQCRQLEIDHMVTPRATIYGQRLIAAGVGRKHLEEMCLWKGLRETDKKKIQRGL